MKRILSLFLLLLTAFFLMGMGDLGGTPEGSVPAVDEDYHVQLTDREGVSVSLSQFSMDGNIVLQGKRGSGTMSIPFSALTAIEVTQTRSNDATVNLSLNEGESLQIKIPGRAVFYGSTGFGGYQIRVDDVTRIDFQP
ncbi:MAG: hypothetical protein C0621_03505 [Desulfuromonas sp.]|nr:MAG: hypothetical protein C0621_03505 [Desulfuromonas sp.]